jgi:hypothetical protein
MTLGAVSRFAEQSLLVNLAPQCMRRSKMRRSCGQLAVVMDKWQTLWDSRKRSGRLKAPRQVPSGPSAGLHAPISARRLPLLDSYIAGSWPS